MSAIAELAEDRVVEGVYAVARKRRLRARSGSDYLALELVDPTGRIEGRVWHDVELLDSRFAEGDAVRVLGRVERFRNALQLDVRSIEQADTDPASLAPAMRRDADELDGFLDFLAAEIAHPGLRATVAAVLDARPARKRSAPLPATPDGHHLYAGGLLEHTVGVATICRELTPAPPAPPRRPAARRGARSTTSAGRSSCGRARPSSRPRRGACSDTSTSACG